MLVGFTDPTTTLALKRVVSTKWPVGGGIRAGYLAQSRVKPGDLHMKYGTEPDCLFKETGEDSLIGDL
jgi:hypothetical protein